MKTGFRLISIATLATAGALASADVAFNDFTTFYGYNNGSGYTVSGAGSANPQFWTANEFTSSLNGTLQDVIIQMSLASGSGTFDVNLCSNSAGTIGSVLESWTGANTDGPFGSANPSVLLFGSGTVNLTAGTQYWLVASPTGPANSTLWAVWNLNSTSVTGTRAYSSDNGATWNYLTNNTLGAFKVDVVTTPEPMSMLALAGGAMLLIRRRRAGK